LYKRTHDLALTWRANLKEACANRFLTSVVVAELEAKFAAFELAYGVAISAFPKGGPGHEALLTQLGAYTDLLGTVTRRAKGDRNRELLLRPLFQIGCVYVDGGSPAAVVTPWHPLRLAAIHQKAHMVANLVRRLLTAEEVFFGDTRLFFKDLAQELSHPFYPEVVLGWQENRPELLALTDCVSDYSLHESPVLGADGIDDTNENPTDGANCVRELVDRYLALHPHEQANMSVVLYNCDSARLPQAVVDKLGQLYEDEEDVRCQVLLRHSDAPRLRELYKTIVETSDSDADAFNASEATQDFMARLRICIIADQAPPPDPKDGCPFDIVFSQDVIARHARVEWFQENAPPIELDQLVPARWSRRRPAARDDMKSVVYLCCPVQSHEGWSYLTALTTFIKGDWDEDEETRLLPARQLDFRDPRTARIFEETHNLGNWVVNYDELLDRRQLLNQNVRVIRYKQSATQGRNIVISSNAPLGLLSSMVLLRIKDLNLGLSEEEHRALADRFIQDANDVSGDIVLRAAKRGRNASELMGIVLSRYVLRNELGLDRLYGWYFLDDYADWLGQREEQIADILALSPEVTADGQFRLAVLITESKYIDSSAVAAKRKESQKQLRDTMKRVCEAVFGSPQRLDRELWLARLSDLILDGVQFPASARVNLSDWRRAIREGTCEIAVRGYSHVFVSDPNEAAECSAFCRVTDLEDAYQEVFGRSDLRELTLRYFRGEDPLPVRRRVSGEDIWTGLDFRRPTDRTPLVPPRRRGRRDRGDDDDLPPSPPPDDSPPTPSVGGESTATAPVAATEEGGREHAIQPGAEHTWAFPGVSALLRPEEAGGGDADTKEWLRRTETTAKHALQQLHLQARLLQSTLTPNCGLLKFAGSANLTVEQVNRRRSELLTTYGLNVVSIRPEAGAVTIGVARPTREVIRTEEVWSRWQPTSEWGNQDLLIGVREDDGELLYLAPGTRHAPHTLVAGSTGSGKSVLMQNIILAIAATNTPEQARIVLIDPKQGVDYFAFEGLPHLDGRLIVEQEDASSRLTALVAEMDARYGRLREARVQNLASFNRKVLEPERLPVIWVVHDEFAEWMLVEDYKEQVTSTVARLGVKARAAGIYLVFAAQRPDANVMPMQLRANLGNRLILKVDSEGTSEIALGEPGAERLLGHGHLLAKLEGSSGLTYAQVPLVEPQFIEQLVNLAQRQDGDG
jgi:S-DNA-T family DNA segregation ATPase FtsK/SpoIIIE